ncbi:MAG: glycosyltransferase family 4 protein [Anaerolineaceae bacterium]|nr:glycosyltransferase family 4 protein [Anaerolineaceae bacterium]
MRILILSNFYPPSRSWGYTQLCEEVSQRLQEHGHTIAVLTSNYGCEEISGTEENVHRLLHLESDPFFYDPIAFFVRRPFYQRQNKMALLALVENFQPDLIFIWGMWNMSRRLPAVAEGLGSPKVVYYLADHWPALPTPHEEYWCLPTRRRYLRPFKNVFASLVRIGLWLEGDTPPLKFPHAMSVSKALRDSLVEKGVAVQNATVVYNGIDVKDFFSKEQSHLSENTLRLVYAGRLTPDKGVHTVIEAMIKLREERQIEDVRLTVVGEGLPGYETSLQRLVEEHQLEPYVEFRGRVDRESMPQLLRQFDVLIFPSISAEALPRMPQEAMACGLAVIGTTTGGTRELIIEGETGLTFPPGNADVLAAQIARLVTDAELRVELTQAGRDYVLQNFTIERMVSEIEAYLQVVAVDPATEMLPATP